MGRSIHTLLALLLLLVALLPACKDFAPEPVPEGSQNPERNFEVFWADVNLNYPFFDLDGVDWRQQYDRYRPQVSASMGEDSLFQVMARMMTPLMDGHASLTYRNRAIGTDVTWANPRRGEPRDFSLSTTLIQYLNVPNGFSFSRIFIKEVPSRPGVLYVYIPSFEGTRLGVSIDSAVRAKGIANVRGIVLDIRNNGGGLVDESERVAGLFTRSEFPFLQERFKNGPRSQDLTPAVTRSIGPYLSLGFTTKPVVLLTNSGSASASERLRLALRELPNAYCMGDTTYGATSPIVNRTLPNGFRYVLVGSITSDLNGVVYERRGIAPDTTIINPVQELNRRDRVLEAALARIR